MMSIVIRYTLLAFPFVFLIDIARFIAIGGFAPVPLPLLAITALGTVIVSIPATAIFLLIRAFKGYGNIFPCVSFLTVFTITLYILRISAADGSNLSLRSFGHQAFIDGEITSFGAIIYLTMYF